MKKISVVTILGILFLFTLATVGNIPAGQTVENNIPSALAPDLPITIDDNSDFESLGFPGNGTVVEPYIIENRTFEIEAGYWMCGIKILNTSVHFVIQNCNFTAAVVKTEEPTYADFGVYMKDVDNGVVRNCIFSELMYGVFLVHCEDIIVENSNFTGMNVNWMQFENMGRGVGTGSLDVINKRIVIRNNYMENCSNGVLLMEVEEFDVYGNTIVTGGTGIHAEDLVTNGKIRQNTILNGTQAGIQCTRLDEISILDNTCGYNELYGIWLDENADDNFVSRNVLMYNGNVTLDTGCGIHVDSLSSGNNITMNDLLFNNDNVENDNPNSFYDLNYYSDYEGADLDGDGVGESPYVIEGAAYTSDLRPRVLRIAEYLELHSPSTTTTLPTTTNSTTTTTDTIGLPLEQIILISGSAVIVIIIVVVIGLKRRP